MIPHRSSLHLTPYVVVTILLTAFPLLYFASPWLLVTARLYFVIRFPFSFSSHRTHFTSRYQTRLEASAVAARPLLVIVGSTGYLGPRWFLALKQSFWDFKFS